VRQHFLPGKLTSYLRRLAAEYEADSSKVIERDIIATCYVRVEPETEHDNWNGGTYGHDVWLYLPLPVLGRVGLKNLAPMRQALLEDLKLLTQSVENEFFRELHLEEIDEADFGCQLAQPITARPPTNPDTVTFWKSGMARLFISHKDRYKAKANSLALALESFGISSFVAHDTIKPMSEWRKEIMKGLETMEVMLVFLTDDFEDSTFTNQEVGYALGANKPILSLKLEKRDPPGFISHEQALRGDLNDPAASARALYPLIAKALGRKSRLDDSLIKAFTSATNFNETRDRFEILRELVPSLELYQVNNIIAAFEENDQLHNAVYLTSNYERLRRFLEKATGRKFEIRGRKIIEIRPGAAKWNDDEIPF
jgi:hypothetical protein